MMFILYPEITRLVLTDMQAYNNLSGNDFIDGSIMSNKRSTIKEMLVSTHFW